MNGARPEIQSRTLLFRSEFGAADHRCGSGRLCSQCSSGVACQSICRAERVCLRRAERRAPRAMAKQIDVAAQNVRRMASWVRRPSFAVATERTTTLGMMNQAADQYGYARGTNTVLTTDFGQTWRAGDPLNGISERDLAVNGSIPDSQRRQRLTFPSETP